MRWCSSGPGNNGGDGLVAAHYLREHEIEVTIYIWKRDPKGDRNLTRLKRRKRGVNILWSDNDSGFSNLRQEVRKTSLVIDALLGTGAARPIGGGLAELLAVVKEEVEAINNPPTVVEQFPNGAPRSPLIEALVDRQLGDDMDDEIDDDLELISPFGADWEDDLDGESDDLDRFDEPRSIASMPAWPLLPVLAVDCPSGLNCDTGALDPAAVPATVTVTFAYPKWGQVEYPGAGACGMLFVVDIGVPSDLGAELQAEIVERAEVRSWLPPRPKDANKGTFGKAMIAGGSLLYTGAPALSAGAAARTGAGLVTLAVPREAHAVLAGSLLEITWLPLPGVDGVHSAEGAPKLVQRLEGYDALLVGPGLTTEDSAAAFLDALLGPGGAEGERVAGAGGL